jgi:hypothetical protein
MTYIRKTVDLFVSEELKAILEQIKNGSEVAKLLLKSRHNREDLLDNHVNYISTSKTNKGMISYLTPERIELVGDELWTSTKRFIAKPGAFLKKLFKEVNERDIEIFTNLYRNVQNANHMDFEVVEGEKIRYYYNSDNHASSSSSLGSSCMRYDSCQPYFDLYCKNPNQIKMLILKDDTKRLIGRALLWQDAKVMDRIYTINDEKYIFQFKKWADEKGYGYKLEQKWNNTLHFESSGEKKFQEICVKLENWDFEYYPYMDTFKFLDMKNGYIYNYKPESNSIVTLNSANGDTLDRDYLQMDSFTKLFHYEDDIVYLDYCDVWTIRTNANWSDCYEKYILRQDSVWNQYLGTHIFSEKKLNDWKQIIVCLKVWISQFPDHDRCSKWERERKTILQNYLTELEENELEPA